MELEPHIDEVTERIIVRLGEDSDSDEWSDVGDSEGDINPTVASSDNDIDSDEDDLAGIVPFDRY